MINNHVSKDYDFEKPILKFDYVMNEIQLKNNAII